MKQAVKTLALFTIFLVFASSSHSQLKVPTINGIATDLKKVIDDYPNRFNNLKGEMLIQHAQSTDYACNFKVNGAEEAIVTNFSSDKQEINSWQALMLTTEDFSEAKKKFRTLYTQLNNLAVRSGNESARLKGNYEAPVEEKKFTSVLFMIEKGGESLEKLKVEIVMQYELLEWKVKVLVYDRDRKDDESGINIE